MGFETCKIKPNTWLRTYRKDHYDCISIHMDDLLIASKDPKSEMCILTNKHSFKLKGTGPISYHFGCDFGHDDDGT